MKKYKQVSKVEFDKYVNDYAESKGVILDRDVTGICEPPLLTINDFSDGKRYPESIIAKAYIMDGSEYYDGKTTEYFIPDQVELNK